MRALVVEKHINNGFQDVLTNYAFFHGRISNIGADRRSASSNDDSIGSEPTEARN